MIYRIHLDINDGINAVIYINEHTCEKVGRKKSCCNNFLWPSNCLLFMEVFSAFEIGCKKFVPFILIGSLFKYSCNWIKRFKRHLYSSELRYLSGMAFEIQLLFLNVNRQIIL